jgi:hypothetical protein
MNRRKRIGCAVAGLVLAGGFLILVRVEGKAHRSPLGIGATAEEAWNYIHTPTAWSTHSLLLDVKRGSWVTHAFDIQCDESYFLRYHWRTNKLVATRHVIYSLGADGAIVGAKSKWKWMSPF